MDTQQAIAEAKTRWGSQAIVSIQTSMLVSSPDPIENTCIVGVLSGSDIHIHGMGHSWKEAFADADNRDRHIKSLVKRRTNV